MSDLDRLLQQVEELKRLANRPDDSWMDNMSNEELRALGRLDRLLHRRMGQCLPFPCHLPVRPGSPV